MTPRKWLNGDVAKIITAFMSGIIMTGVAHFIVLGRDVTTRQEVIEMIPQYSPYMEDRAAIQQSLRRLESDLIKLDVGQNRLMEMVSKIQYQIGEK